jgi:hypothetical protein
MDTKNFMNDVLESVKKGFTLAMYWNGGYSGMYCPVCCNGLKRGHTKKCPRNQANQKVEQK